MFDTEKIRRMTTLLGKMPEEFDDVYLIPEKSFLQETAALFKQLKIPIRAIMHDTLVEKEARGIPVVKTAQASANFNERTALILLVEKPVPFVQTTFDFRNRRGEKYLTVPAFVMTNDEAQLIYDILKIETLKRLYNEEGISEPKKSPDDLAKRFARALNAMLNPQLQNFKYQFSDSRWFFKPTYAFDDTAIVIQGPINYTNNYTAETFKLYRSIYPNAPIVVSTWKNEATDAFRRECKENSVVLLENEPPNFRGPWNVNMQLKSSLEGVRYVKENTSAKFVLKTRTDQRINYFNFLVYFKNLLETFPPKDNKIRERIIFLGSSAVRFYPLFLHDFLAFGHVEDIFKLYNIPFHGEQGKLNYIKNHAKRFDKIKGLIQKAVDCGFDYNSVTEQSHKLLKLNKMMNRICWPEMYITRNFYEKYIAPVDETKLYETSWKFTVDYLILVDFETIQLDWPKYERMRYKQKFIYGGQDAFASWLDMYRNFKIDWV